MGGPSSALCWSSAGRSGDGTAAVIISVPTSLLQRLGWRFGDFYFRGTWNGR